MQCVEYLGILPVHALSVQEIVPNVISWFYHLVGVIFECEDV
jgi:hypothetical protein